VLALATTTGEMSSADGRIDRLRGGGGAEAGGALLPGPSASELWRSVRRRRGGRRQGHRLDRSRLSDAYCLRRFPVAGIISVLLASSCK